MSGYTSLLLAWAYEHFPDALVRRYQNRDYVETEPRACKWIESRTGHARLQERRVLFDEMTSADVIWTPYEAHRSVRPQDARALFSGYIRTPYGPAVRPHLPERVLWQFGSVQTVPRHPSVVMERSPGAEDVDAAFAAYEQYLVPEGVPATVGGQTSSNYMDWYSMVSHRFIIPDTKRAELSAVVSMKTIFFYTCDFVYVIY